jgi:hypothetical protein
MYVLPMTKSKEKKNWSFIPRGRVPFTLKKNICIKRKKLSALSHQRRKKLCLYNGDGVKGKKIKKIEKIFTPDS